MADTNAGSIFYDVKIDTKGLASAGTAVKNFAKGATVALTAASAAAVAFGVSAFKAYEEAEVSAAQLRRAVVDVTGATEAQLLATSNLADELERKGVLDGDNIKMGLAQLSTFGLSNDAVQGLAGSLADLAVNQYGVSASGDQLTDSANMIAKALRGEFGMLQKSGIRFTDAQQRTIKYGTELEKVAAINEGFAQNLKYTNEIASKTSEGGLAKLKVNIDNVREAIGGAIANGINPLVQKLSEFVQSDQFQLWVTDLTNWLTVNLPLAFDYMTNTLIPNLQMAFETAKPYIQGAFDVIKGLADFFATTFGDKTDEAIIAIAGVGLAFKALSVTVGTPLVMPAIVVAAAITALTMVINKMLEAKAAIESAGEAIKNNISVNDQILKASKEAYEAGDTAKADKLFKIAESGYQNAAQQLNSLAVNPYNPASFLGFSNGGFTGLGASNEVAGVVHRGEFVVPKNMVDQSTGTPKMGGIENHIGTINISSDVDGEKWLQRLTQNQEIISKGLVPTQRYA